MQEFPIIYILFKIDIRKTMEINKQVNCRINTSGHFIEMKLIFDE